MTVSKRVKVYVGATNKKILEDKIGFQKLTEDFDDLSYTAEKVFINPVLGTSEVTFLTTGLTLTDIQAQLHRSYKKLCFRNILYHLTSR